MKLDYVTIAFWLVASIGILNSQSTSIFFTSLFHPSQSKSTRFIEIAFFHVLIHRVDLCNCYQSSMMLSIHFLINAKHANRMSNCNKLQIVLIEIKPDWTEFKSIAEVILWLQWNWILIIIVCFVSFIKSIQSKTGNIVAIIMRSY